MYSVALPKACKLTLMWKLVTQFGEGKISVLVKLQHSPKLLK